MGQAFDKYGDLLGTAVGETKREVFEALNKNHPYAAEIRIRSITDDATEQVVREFIGWLTADISELHSIEVPVLTDSWARFKAARRDKAVTRGNP